MEEQLIGFETWKLAREKGFSFCIILDDIESRPSQSLLQKWLREKHKIEVNPCHSCSGRYDLWTNWGNLLPDSNGLFRDFETYEEALEQGLQEALKTI